MGMMRMLRWCTVSVLGLALVSMAMSRSSTKMSLVALTSPILAAKSLSLQMQS